MPISIFPIVVGAQLVVAVAGPATSAASLLGLLLVELVGCTALMGRPAALAGDLAALLGVHGREAAKTFLGHRGGPFVQVRSDD